MRLPTMAATAILLAMSIPIAAAESLTTPKVEWTIDQLNLAVDQANFIVAGGCSGTLISTKHKLILTAHHCVSGYIKTVDKDVTEDGEVKKKKIEVFSQVTVEQKYYAGASDVGTASFQTDIVEYDADTDLALLKIKAATIPQTAFIGILPKNAEVRRGEGIYVIGNPGGEYSTVTKGIIASLTREIAVRSGVKLSFLQLDAEVFFGNSGGAVVTDTGYYVGTVSRGIPGTAVVFAIHYKHVRDLLTKACYGKLWDEGADDEKCLKNASKDDEESTQDLLRAIRDKLME